MSFRVNNFRSTWAKSIILFSKCSKFDEHSKSAIRHAENVFSSSDNCLSIGSGKFSLINREYLSSLLKVLTSSPKKQIGLKITFSSSVLPKMMQK